MPLGTTPTSLSVDPTQSPSPPPSAHSRPVLLDDDGEGDDEEITINSGEDDSPGEASAGNEGNGEVNDEDDDDDDFRPKMGTSQRWHISTQRSRTGNQARTRAKVWPHALVTLAEGTGAPPPGTTNAEASSTPGMTDVATNGEKVTEEEEGGLAEEQEDEDILVLADFEHCFTVVGRPQGLHAVRQELRFGREGGGREEGCIA